jgi:phosphoglycolate phosphatase-like HAD superfamily hydrolase
VILYIIWDAGGSLFDTYPAAVKAFQKTLEEFGCPVPARRRILRLARRSTGHAQRVLAEECGLDPQEVDAGYDENYAAIPAEIQPPFPGVVAVCAYVRSLGGQNFIVTHRARSSLRRLLSAHGMERYFTDTITKDDPYPRKPDPTSLREMVARHNLDFGMTLAVGDRPIDVEAAHRAGLRACFYGDPPSGLMEGNDLAVSNYRTLLELIRYENEEAFA